MHATVENQLMLPSRHEPCIAHTSPLRCRASDHCIICHFGGPGKDELNDSHEHSQLILSDSRSKSETAGVMEQFLAAWNLGCSKAYQYCQFAPSEDVEERRDRISTRQK